MFRGIFAAIVFLAGAGLLLGLAAGSIVGGGLAAVVLVLGLIGMLVSDIRDTLDQATRHPRWETAEQRRLAAEQRAELQTGDVVRDLQRQEEEALERARQRRQR